MCCFSFTSKHGRRYTTKLEEEEVGYITRKIPEYLFCSSSLSTVISFKKYLTTLFFLFCSSDSFQTLSSLNIPKCFNIIGEDEFPFQIYWGRGYFRERDTTCLNIERMIPSSKVLGKDGGRRPIPSLRDRRLCFKYRSEAQ